MLVSLKKVLTWWNDKIWVVSCYFEKIDSRAASYFSRVAVLKE